LEIGVVFLNQNFLEKRIDGAKLIDAVCKAAILNKNTSKDFKTGGSESTGLTAQLSEKLKSKNVLSLFFSKKDCHAQLVQRSEGLLKLLIGQKALNDEEMELVWSCTRLDEAICLNFYKALNEIGTQIGYDEIYFFIEKIVEKATVNTKSQEVELLQSLATKSVGKANSNRN